MKFPAESLAVIASQARGSEGFDVRNFAVNANQRDSGRLEEASSPRILNNGNSLSEVASNILDKLRDLQDVVECDPQAEIHEERKLTNQNSEGTDSFDDDMELGILSSVCGVGRKCHEGICVDAGDWNIQFQQRILQETNSTSEEGFTTAIEVLQYACDVGDLVGYDCECNLSPDAYEGNITCTTPVQCKSQTSVCDLEVTDCYETTHTFVLKGTTGHLDGEYCKHFIEPFEQIICYQTSTEDAGATVSEECSILLDGEECSGCSAYKVDDLECFNFDCSNTALAGDGRGSRIGNTCSLPAHSMGLFLETYGCPSCDLCGENMAMTLPNTLDLWNKTYECSYVEGVAKRGYFTIDSCTYFSGITREACGCVMRSNETEEVTGTESPTSIFIETGAICEVCPDGVSNPDAMLSMPGSTKISCSEIETAGLDGSIVGEELCEAVQERAAGPCCGETVPSIEEDITTEDLVEEYCTLCGPEKTHTSDDETLVSVPTQGIYSCGELLELGQNGTLDENGICLLVQLSADTPCGCVADGPTMAPSNVTVGDSYDVPSSATRTSMAGVLAFVGGAAMFSYFL